MPSKSKFFAELLDGSGDIKSDHLDNTITNLGNAFIPSSEANNFLLKSNNLSDLQNIDSAKSILGVIVEKFAEWSIGIVGPNVTLPVKEKQIHYEKTIIGSDFTLNLTGEAEITNLYPASYTNVDTYISTGLDEVMGYGNSNGRVVTKVPDAPLLWYDSNGDGTYKIGRITVGRGYLDGKYDSGYIGYDVTWNPGGDLTAGQTLAIASDLSTEWKYGGLAGNTVNIGAPLYLGYSWPGDMTAENKAGYYLRSVSFEVHADPAWIINTSFNDSLAVGESMTVVFMMDVGATAYKVSNLQIDGVSQSVKWSFGMTPEGTANSRDVYSYTILKIADSTYSVLGNYTSYI
jgi:hypothetical protein